MSSLNLTIRPQTDTRKIMVELDADKLEKLAASLGFFSSNFLKSLNRSEKDYKLGRIRKIKSLKDLRK